MNTPRLISLLALSTLAGLSAGQGVPSAPATQPPAAAAPAPARDTATPPGKLTEQQINAELISIHRLEHTLNSDLAKLTKSPTAKLDDGLSYSDVVSRLDLVRNRDEALNNELLRRRDDQKLKDSIDQANSEGLEVQIGSIAHYRGDHKYQLVGIGLVVGLDSTGDSNKQVVTQNLYSNWLKSQNLTVAPTNVQSKNAAIVQVTVEMPSFTKPGTHLDVTVSSIGDAKSLQGGFLVPCPLYSFSDFSHESIIATAGGGLSIGGFNASANGSKVQKNHVTVGQVVGGAEVQKRIETQLVFEDGTDRKVLLDLDTANSTTVSRIVKALNAKNPRLNAAAVDDSTVSVTIPKGADAEATMSEIDRTSVFADTPASVVINERTGTIVVGGNVTIGPAVVVSGSLSIKIETENTVSQPGPFSGGTTTPVSNSTVSADQTDTKVALIRPTTKIYDLAKLFTALHLEPNDVIKILTLLKQQGALTARIITE